MVANNNLKKPCKEELVKEDHSDQLQVRINHKEIQVVSLDKVPVNQKAYHLQMCQLVINHLIIYTTNQVNQIKEYQFRNQQDKCHPELEKCLQGQMEEQCNNLVCREMVESSQTKIFRADTIRKMVMNKKEKRQLLSKILHLDKCQEDNEFNKKCKTKKADTQMMVQKVVIQLLILRMITQKYI